MLKFTSIVLLNYNSYIDTKNCIKSFLFHHTKNENIYSFIIVDNKSNDNSLYNIKKFLKEDLNKNFQEFNESNFLENLKNEPFTILKLDRNYGYAKGNNFGIKLAINLGASYLLVLNSDILITQNILDPLCNFVSLNSEFGIVSPVLYKKNGDFDYNCARKSPTNLDIFIEFSILRKFSIFKKMLKKRYLLKNSRLDNLNYIIIDLPSGSCMFCKTSLMYEINFFDENTFLYYEENILYEKLKKVGLYNVLLLSISAIHLGAQTTNKSKSYKIVNYNYKSVIYYLKNYRSNAVFLIYYLKIKKVLINIYLKILNMF